MQQDYQIVKGSQYDRNGATVFYGRNQCLTARYSAKGILDSGDLPGVAERQVIDEAVARVIATGIQETITVGITAPSDDAIHHNNPADCELIDGHCASCEER